MANADLVQGYNRLVDMLIDMTEAGDVRWERTANEDVFIAPFGDHSVGIAAVPDVRAFALTIHGLQGESVEEIDARDLGGGAWTVDAMTKMRRLHESARRYAMGAADALNALLAELDARSRRSAPSRQPSEPATQPR